MGLLPFAALLLGCPPEVAPPPAAPPSTASVAATTAPSPQPRRCILSGTVTSDKGVKVPGAIVAAVAPSSELPVAVEKTDAEGRYCFPSLDTGSFGFTITTPDLTSEYADVSDVSPRGVNQAVMHFRVGGPGHVLSGTVRDDKGAPLPRARIIVQRFSEFLADLFVVETGADGAYRVKLPEGRYALSVRGEGETVMSTQLAVNLEQDTTTDLAARRVNPKSEPAPDAVVAWVKSKAIPLRSPEAGSGFDDLAPVGDIVGDAKIVALGEATHGTREFFQLKHRMLEYLVEKKGFRVFGIEASLGDCLPLSEYVKSGKGDPAAALANQGFWTWDTEEVLALVKWMRAYNEDKAHVEKLSFWGFDMQSPASSAQALVAFLEKADPKLAKELGPALEPVDDDFSAHNHDSAPKALLAGAKAAAQKIADKLVAERAELVRKLSPQEIDLLEIHARIVIDYLGVHEGGAGLRDRSMADIVTKLHRLEHYPPPVRGGGAPPKGQVPQRRMVLWAHNGHVNRHANYGLPSMGSFLAERLRDDYRVLGFAFDEGSFQAYDPTKARRGVIPFTVPPALPGSLDHTLGRAGIPMFALDLRAAPAGPAGDWFSRVAFSRSIGSTFDETVPDFGYEAMVAPQQFDALLFVQKTTAARPTATGKRKGKTDPKPPLPALSDPGFEAAEKGKTPDGWVASGYPRQLEYKVSAVDGKCASGKRCIEIERAKGTVSTGEGIAAVDIDATPYRGKKIRVTSRAKVTSRGIGEEAFLIAFVTEAQIAFSPISGASWESVHVDLSVPEGAERIRLGAAITGAAKAGLDDLKVEVVSSEKTP